MNKIWDLKQFYHNLAIIDEYGNRLTYQELETETEKLVSFIKGRCLIFSLCRNEIASVLGYVGFLQSGVVPVLLNSGLEEELFQNLLSAYKPDYLFMPQERAVGYPDMKKVYTCYDYVLLKTNYNADYSLYEELALLLTTSGSTGSPKFVRQSYKNITENTKSIAEYLKLDSTEKPITTLPMNYTYGLSIINTHLYVGATLLLTEKTLMQKEFWTFFKNERATSFGGVPYTYEILDKLRFYRMDLPSLKSFTQAGGKILPDLHQKFAEYAEKTGKRFVVMYGQCEATARMGYLPPEKALEKKGSMGIAIPGGKFVLEDDNGQEIKEPFKTGELVYFGDNVTLGYAESAEDLAKGDERGGVLKTGDMAQFDEDGYFYIVGRKKRFLKIYGNRVNLDEIDRLIKTQFSVEAASTGTDDHMYIFLTDEKYSEDVREYVINKTRLNGAAFKVIVIDEIPKNDSGKILYKELNRYYQN